MHPAKPAPELVVRPSAGRVFEGARPVRLADVRPSGHLRLDAAARYLQDLSADDTADADLPDAAHWVVRRTVLRVDAFPRYLERLRLATWCSGIGSHYAERRVDVEGDGGGRVAASSLWVHLDATSGRPRRLGEGFEALYGTSAAGRKPSARLRHGGPPDGVDARPWSLRSTDFDLLDHVNNSVYWQVVEEALASRPLVRAPVVAELEHRQAIERGATVTWSTAARDDGGLALWILDGATIAATAVVAPMRE
ncbi:MAG TPA: acyl-ACP thioesterase domain-containing protein [Acidimicrobiales bacterium]|nr:acyl-ACP thioesterase domain-containing protein [Acidimicrobiales bacterium]